MSTAPPERPLRGVDAAVLIAHGSADPRHAEGLGRLVDRLRALHENTRWSAAFLDHHGPDLEAAVAAARTEAGGTVAVVPALLSSAFHAGVDVPAAIAGARSAHRDVDLRVCAPLGPDERIVMAALRDLPPGAVAVVAAAGTSDGAARAAFAISVGRASAATGRTAVAAFIAGGAPTVAEAVALARREATAPDDVVLVPFVLTGGVLLDRGTEQALGAAALPALLDRGIVRDAVVDVILDRVRDA